MTITHHPDVSTLMSCAAGSQPEAQAAIVASHLSMCPVCAREVGRMEKIGAVLFEGIEPVAMTRPVPVAAARSQEADTPAPRSAKPAASSAIPYPLREKLGLETLDDVPWKRVATGVWLHALPMSEGANGYLFLLKVAPGVRVPDHGHDGEELTLLLDGSYADATGVYKKGDVADLDPDVEHSPLADAATGCICLVASEKQARFKGLFARIVQPLTGL